VDAALALEFEATSGVYTELQCGSYIFMDADYGRNLDRDGAPTKAFEPSLYSGGGVRPGGNGAAEAGGGGGERAAGGRQSPVYLSASGYGVVKPSVSVPRKVTIRSSS
jgi:3-hydroxy-D-aspartate aldolase